MPKRFLSIWFRHLKTDWFSIRKPALCKEAYVLASPERGRMVITASNASAQAMGVDTGMVVADARAIIPSLLVLDDRPQLSSRLLKGLAEWCIRYTPVVAIDPPGGLILDITGCAHLWGGEKPYLNDIIARLKGFGYKVYAAIADTMGAAWAMSHFGKEAQIIPPGLQSAALLPLPTAALRLEPEILEKLQKLGLQQVSNVVSMPRQALRRRFGQPLIHTLDQVLGLEEEPIDPVHPVVPYQERLPCLEPIVTATGITIALQRLLETLCKRLQQDQKGLRTACFRCFRVDGRIEKAVIGTHKASYNPVHLSTLFECKLADIEPGLGIEVFVLEAPKVEDLSASQETIWEGACGLQDTGLAELIDRLSNKVGADRIHRYLPDEHYWPERSVKLASTLQEEPSIPWRSDRPRPLKLLSKPEPIEVAAPIPDYPPMLFRHKGRVHTIKKADGPERIEREWWLEAGQHRDYYCVEDEEGHRYWLFRSGHYTVDKSYQWFIHGFFA